MTQYNYEVLTFWFQELSPQQWWTKDVELDLLISNRFKTLHKQAASGELATWRESAHGRLAEIIVLDQFSRNIYRDTPQAFAQDPLALELALSAIADNADKQLTDDERSFLYMPLMHSESPEVHKQALPLFESLGGSNLSFEKQHKAIIDQFGRYPHRNEILGRESTTEEIEFLSQPNSSF